MFFSKIDTILLIVMETKFSENLKRLRAENRISQSILAEKLHTSVKTISHWETGYSEPSLKQLLELACFFNLTTDDLLT